MLVSDILNKDNNNLTLIRIFLAGMVILGHTLALNGHSNFFIDPVKFLFHTMDSGSWAVKLFFFISGLVITNSALIKNDFIYFIVARFFRIMPPLIFVLLISVFIAGPLFTSLSLNSYFSNAQTWYYLKANAVFQTVYLLPGVFHANIYPDVVNGSLWTLHYEIVCYIALLFSCLLPKKIRRPFITIICSFIILKALMVSKFFIWGMSSQPENILLAVSFAFGCLFSIYGKKIPVNLYTTLAVIIIFIVFRNTKNAAIFFILASCTCVLYIASNKWFNSFKIKNDISYGIYLWGFLIQQTIYHFIGHTYAWLHCLLALVLAALLALITHFVIEKPGIECGRRLFKWIQNKWYPKLAGLSPNGLAIKNVQ